MIIRATVELYLTKPEDMSDETWQEVCRDYKTDEGRQQALYEGISDQSPDIVFRSTELVTDSEP